MQVKAKDGLFARITLGLWLAIWRASGLPQSQQRSPQLLSAGNFRFAAALRYLCCDFVAAWVKVMNLDRFDLADSDPVRY